MKSDIEPYLRSMGLALTGRDGGSCSAFSEADWIAWAEIAKREGLAPLLYHAQESTGWPLAIPGRERQALRKEYLKAGGSNLLIYRELARVVSVESGCGHSAIPIDGRSFPWNVRRHWRSCRGVVWVTRKPRSGKSKTEGPGASGPFLVYDPLRWNLAGSDLP